MRLNGIQHLEKVVIKINQRLIKILKGVLSVLFTGLIFIVLANAVCRYVLKRPLFWVMELSCYTLVYLIFMGAALALYRGEHVCINTNGLKIPAALKFVCEKISVTFNYLFIVALIIFGIIVSFKNMKSYTGSLPIPMGCVYLAAPLSGIVMFLFYTEHVLTKKGG